MNKKHLLLCALLILQSVGAPLTYAQLPNLNGEWSLGRRVPLGDGSTSMSSQGSVIITQLDRLLMIHPQSSNRAGDLEGYLWQYDREQAFSNPRNRLLMTCEFSPNRICNVLAIRDRDLESDDPDGNIILLLQRVGNYTRSNDYNRLYGLFGDWQYTTNRVRYSAVLIPGPGMVQSPTRTQRARVAAVINNNLFYFTPCENRKSYCLEGRRIEGTYNGSVSPSSHDRIQLTILDGNMLRMTGYVEGNLARTRYNSNAAALARMGVLARDPETGGTLIHKLVTRSEVYDDIRSELQELTGFGVKINDPNQQGYTPLWLAAAKEDFNLVQALLAFGADPRVPGRDGRNLLELAIYNEDWLLIQELISMNAFSAQRAYEYASSMGKNEIAELLLDYEVKATPGGIEQAVRGKDRRWLQKTLQKGQPDYAVIRKGLATAIEESDLSFFELICTEAKVRVVDTELFNLASDKGETAIAAFMLEQGMIQEPDNALAKILKNNQASLVALALEQGARPDPVFPYAVNPRNPQLIQYLLVRGRRLNKESYYATALAKEATKVEDARIVRTALRYQVDVSSVLPVAVVGREGAVVKLLLDEGANPNCCLLDAAQLGYPEIAKELINYGARSTTQVLQHYVDERNHELVELLLRKGGDATQPGLIVSASKSGDVRIASLLLNARPPANPTRGLDHAVNNMDSSMVRLLLRADARAEERHLRAAVERGNRYMVALLALEGLPTQASLRPAVERGFVDIVKILIKHNANPTDPSYIILAAENDDVPMVDALVRERANPEAALWPALRKNNARVVGHLVKLGVNVSEKNIIRYAIENGSEEVALALLDGNVDPRATYEDGPSVLHIAVEKSREDVASELLHKGAHVNAIDTESGLTPMHIAAREGDMPMMLVLNDFDADLNGARRENGCTLVYELAPDRALRKGSIRKWLKSQGLFLKRQF